MRPILKQHRSGSAAKMTASLEFNTNGTLRAVYFNAETDGDQENLERAFRRLVKPDHVNWIDRFFRRGPS